MLWEKVISSEELAKKNKTIFKKGNKQIAVFKLKDQFFALDNRCPHEGYPLLQGNVNTECVLTCNWHNWKFDMKSGQCLTGGDNVRIYPLKEEDDFIWVNIAEPSIEEITNSILEGFKIGFLDRQYGRMSRELARLYYNKIDPLTAIKKTIEWSYDKFEYGMTHAFAATADWLQLYALNKENPENQIICLTEAVDHISFDSLRFPTFPFKQDIETWSENDFLEAIENENHDKAIALVLGALSENRHFSDLENALVKAALMHYNDFGHSLIYVYKSATLIEFLGNEVEKPLILSLVRSLCYTTRDDLLPEFKEYPTYLAQVKITKQNLADEYPDSLEIFGKSVNFTMNWVVDKLKIYWPENIYQTLLEVNARNLLHYDINYQYAYNNPVNDNVGWLDFTHAITFANAIRKMCEKYPDLWQAGLLQLACFSGRNQKYLKEINESEWIVNDEKIFWQETIDKLYDHGIAGPIFSAHLIKTSFAIKEESEVANQSCKKYLLASLNRFINSPIKAKHVRRTIKQGMELVARDFV